ncbi:MAG: hypothetical protein J0I47_12910 [Sphingomonas sp.]|uniref:hypothetical protein n=1 Tax=Sphingomonas sp. TaxID=28214 RepID=UPI001ACF54F3|nr:hypothetical protein [Sphingomonas sp.]MBN8809117.1 hypothetical protein [Sphingomonas sp.]
MRDDLPAPEQIMEELADRAIAQIDRRAPVAFEGALDELVRYHRFLIGLHATETEDGRPFSYAEVSGAAWHAPHIDWIRQYRRLFDRAAERIPDEQRFLDALAYVPYRLLDAEPGVRLSKTVVEGILDLQPILMHAIEAWVTRRSIIEGDANAAGERVGLSGSDARALAKVMPGMIGAWEANLNTASPVYGWQVEADTTAEETWARYVSAWPFLRQHLANTAYCLAVAVWNGDKTGARLFREALVRWPGSALLDVQRDGLDRFPWLLMPELLEGAWAAAAGRSARVDHPFLPQPAPGGIFAEIVDGARQDVLLVTASMMLVWSIGGGAVGDLAAVTARELVSGTGSDPTEPNAGGLDFKTVVEGLIRLQLVGERYQDGTHGHWLDRLVSSMDSMREDAVVPGRVYTPTTMHDREQLVMGDMALIAALAPGEGSAGVADDLDAIAADEALPPLGDRSLRDILMEFDRYRHMLATQPPGLPRAIQALAPDADAVTAIANLVRVMDDATATIACRRRERLLAKEIDAPAMEELRAAIEADMLAEPAVVPVFDEVGVFLADEGRGDERRTLFNGIAKGKLVRPEMEQASSNWTEFIAKHAREAAGGYAFAVFARMPREPVDAVGELDDPAFWRAMPDLVRRVGDRPVLIVAHQDAIDRLGRLRFGRDDPLAGFAVSYQRTPRERGRHVVTIEGVEVFAADIPRGTAWLTSAWHLRRIGYAPVAGGRVSLAYELDDGAEATVGSLVVGFRQVLEWGDSPVLEFRLGAIGREGDATAADGE